MGKMIKVTNIVQDFEFKEEIFKRLGNDVTDILTALSPNKLYVCYDDNNNILFKKDNGQNCTLEELEQLFLVLRSIVMFKDSRQEYEEFLEKIKVPN